MSAAVKLVPTASLNVKVKVTAPRAETEEQRKAYTKLAKAFGHA